MLVSEYFDRRDLETITIANTMTLLWLQSHYMLPNNAVTDEEKALARNAADALVELMLYQRNKTKGDEGE